MKKALITGITGQDGSYLAEFLLSKGYQVHGIIRRASTFNTGRIDHIFIDPHDPGARLFLHFGDLSDAEQISNLIYNIKPDEIYHLGAQSHVRVSFDIPEYTGNVTALGTIRLLDAIRRSGHKIKLYNAASSEMFGDAPAPQSGNTPFQPQSPYACAKVYAYWMVKNYRDGYGLFACNGILFNHESPRRGETFVTRKITRGLANIMAGRQKQLYMGNLDAKRDWGFAPEYVELMWLMLQQRAPDDYVVGTAEAHSVREFIEKAFSYAGVALSWRGKGAATQGVIDSVDGRVKSPRFLKKGYTVIEIDRDYFRPNEVDCLCADITKVKKALRWQPQVKFKNLIKIMVDYDLKATGITPPGEGLAICRQKRFGYIERSSS
ncbi:MAG: GDP-mannose 4,6-dehydratase [Candidatus Omnitrophica bacterium]|nr:GDP-mannose 4,6-dehydratase [Candidatus Omnitrophota bacterium]MDD5774978.1 GDP-mannose 4,6-dehydratase [Candidatus Omnitrophota bacterium]